VTYSIVARDPATGDLGVGVQSHWFAAASDVGWAEAGVGAVATQASIEISHGPDGLALLRDGVSPERALRALLASDVDAEHRQVGIVDGRGRAAAHTGASCIPEAGHRLGPGFSVQANMMLRPTVWDAMRDAFERTPGDLAHRLLATLDAGEAEGGDVRGRQAAGIDVVRAGRTSRPWDDVLVHLHVDDHPEPLRELRRLLDLKLAYDHLDASERLGLEGDPRGASFELAAALRLAPKAAEIAFWAAVQQAAEGRFDDARRTIAPALEEHDGWSELLRRLVERRLVVLAPEALDRLLGGR
jgi:uncharacterized Ntn-hydrolase superfamily protein